MADPVVAAERFLFGTLTGDATIAAIVSARIYGYIAPPAAAHPYILYTQRAAGDDLTALGAIRIYSQFVYDVRVVDKTESYIALEAGSAAITAALHKASGSNVSGAIVGCVKESPFSMPELDRDGSQLRHLGGTFRLYVQ